MTRFRLPILRVNLAVLATFFVCLLLAYGVGTLIPGAGQMTFTSARDSDQDIYLLDISRGLAFNLTHSVTNEWQAVWSPAGTQIAFVSDRDGNYDIFTLAVGCPGLFAPCPTRIQQITTNPGSDFDPAWSPDGQHIAFTSDRFGYAEIFVADLKGSVPLRLTNNRVVDVNPAWSPDGKKIVFSSNSANPDDVDLYIMDADGGNPHRILEKMGNEFAPSFAPDGRHLVYGSYVGGSNRQLAILDLQTQQSTLLLDDRGNDDTPTFSPDGQSLAFMSYVESSNSEIFTVRLDCAGTRAACARRLTFSRYMDIYPRWRPQSH